jgi:Ca2+-binding EF-hand superfamily protein
MKATIVSATLALAIAGTLTAVAQDGPPKPERERRGPPPELIKKFDKDGDGQLSEEERKAAREAMEARRGEFQKKMLEQFDKDGDGKLSEEERKAAREAGEAKRKEILEKYDKDGDGKLSEEERKAAIDAGEQIPPRPMRRPGGPRGEGDRPGRPEGGRPGPRGPQGPPKDAPDA